jgi:hypothetical protein
MANPNNSDWEQLTDEFKARHPEYFQPLGVVPSATADKWTVSTTTQSPTNIVDWVTGTGINNDAEMQHKWFELRKQQEDREASKTVVRKWVEKNEAEWRYFDVTTYKYDPVPVEFNGYPLAVVQRVAQDGGPDVYIASTRTQGNNVPMMAFGDLERAQRYATTIVRLTEANTDNTVTAAPGLLNLSGGGHVDNALNAVAPYKPLNPLFNTTK